MKRMYVAVIEARGKEMARSRPMEKKDVMEWLEDQKRYYRKLLVGNWCSYLLTMSEPATEKINREKGESEQEKTLNKDL